MHLQKEKAQYRGEETGAETGSRRAEEKGGVQALVLRVA
jgi:hypothetical protein